MSGHPESASPIPSRITNILGLAGTKAVLLTIAETVRASYWFLPAVMVVCSILLASLTQWLDARVDPGWLEGFEWLYSNQTVGARAVLSTIASSMITVAGVTFSMTIVSVSNASAQFGPRLVANFMRDRGNQITLGIFIATFTYCLMVLRGVRDGVADDSEVVAFIPHISVLVAVLLAFASISVLIYFIHHVPETINVGNIIAKIGRDLRRSVDELFDGNDEPTQTDLSGRQGRTEFETYEIAQSTTVASDRSGYVRALDLEEIFAIACKHDVKVRVEYVPGDFALVGEAIFYVLPGERASEDCVDALRACVSLSERPDRAQDVRFLVDQLVEIIARALSPGVNDPYTAINCLNLLMDSLALATRRSSPASVRMDSDGNARVVSNPYDFERLAKSIFRQSLQYVASDRNVTLHVMHMIATVGSRSNQPAHREALRKHADEIAAVASDAIGNRLQAAEIERAADLVGKILEGDADVETLREGEAWLGGSG
ncbi:MAG: DUF2254 domain-containing protein [Alphaproteobacteria bacterium]|nr:DUF2254 domain-containing protein [Alphaproteobacteria bacterium]